MSLKSQFTYVNQPNILPPKLLAGSSLAQSFWTLSLPLLKSFQDKGHLHFSCVLTPKADKELRRSVLCGQWEKEEEAEQQVFGASSALG